MTNGTQPENTGGLIPPHGGYRDLVSYQMAEIVYDATVKFCDRFIDRKSRTHDQMVQAARSGNKNLAEGSQVSGTSKKSELKLVGVARGSLEELLGDYRDFLRQRGLVEWGKEHPMARLVRGLAYEPDRSYRTYSTYIENAPAEVAANTMLCQVNQANYLIDQQKRQLEREFLEHGVLLSGSIMRGSRHAKLVTPSRAIRRARVVTHGEGPWEAIEGPQAYPRLHQSTPPRSPALCYHRDRVL
jgi:four helix bundle suffix protein